MLRALAVFSLITISTSGLSIHHRLTSQELLRLFGTESYADVPKYQIAFTKPHTLHKRSLIPNNDRFYQLNMDGTNLTLHLQPNRNLISPYFILKPDGLNVNMTAAAECLYHGSILSGNGRAAVSVCGETGLTGIIETDSGHYQIHPVPARLQENVIDHGHMHVLVPKNETGTFCGVHELNTPQKLMAESKMRFQKQPSPRRRREAVVDKLYIETAVFADYMLYRTLVGKTLLPDHDAFVKYVLAIVNTVQLIYNDPSLGRAAEIVLVRLEILQNENLPFYNEEVDRYLWDFCKWQSGLNPGTDLSTPNHWDHAIILTGFDLRSGVMRSVTGYAPVGGMCNPMYSCTINEGNHFGSAFVIAHEMGHSLTMQHDGQAGISGNGCDAQRFLMSPSTGRGKTTWSSCSRNYLDAFLLSSQSACLKDVPPGREGAVDFNSGSLPGQLYPPDDQCKLLYGVEFHRYSMQPDADVCEILICANTTVYITGHPALPGTFCGEGHWCSGGYCVPWGAGGPIAIDGGWSAWPGTTDCTANCVLPGSGLRIFSRSCTNPLPANGGKTCEGKERRYRTCDQSALCNGHPSLSIGQYANQQCLSTKTVQSDATLTGQGRQRLQDPTGGCVIWCDTFQGGYKTWGSKFPDGTDCNGGNGKSFCIEGQCKAIGCDGWTLDESSSAACQTTQIIELPTTPSRESMFAVKDTSRGSVVTTPSSLRDITSSTPSPKVLLFPNNNPFYATIPQSWGAWENTSPCISSCLQNSTGLRKIARRCEDSSSGTCFGRNATIFKCSTPCPKIFFTADMYVAKICSALRTVDHGLSGTGRQLPHNRNDAKQACKLWCQKDATLRSWPDMFFPDGTLCATDGLFSSYCVKGVCTQFGCDGKPFDTSDPAKCESQFSQKLILDSKKDASPGKPSVIDFPQTGLIPQTQPTETLKFQWMVVSTPCSRSCGGGTRKNHVYCTQTTAGSLKSGQKMEESLCGLENKPDTVLEESCNTQACPQWSVSGWGDCSAACGNGTQTRLVQCVQASPPIGSVRVESIFGDSQCDLDKKPVLTQRCTRKPCLATESDPLVIY